MEVSNLFANMKKFSIKGRQMERTAFHNRHSSIQYEGDGGAQKFYNSVDYGTTLPRVNNSISKSNAFDSMALEEYTAGGYMEDDHQSLVRMTNLPNVKSRIQVNEIDREFNKFMDKLQVIHRRERGNQNLGLHHKGRTTGNQEETGRVFAYQKKYLHHITNEMKEHMQKKAIERAINPKTLRVTPEKMMMNIMASDHGLLPRIKNHRDLPPPNENQTLLRKPVLVSDTKPDDLDILTAAFADDLTNMSKDLQRKMLKEMKRKYIPRNAAKSLAAAKPKGPSKQQQGNNSPVAKSMITSLENAKHPTSLVFISQLNLSVDENPHSLTIMRKEPSQTVRESTWENTPKETMPFRKVLNGGMRHLMRMCDDYDRSNHVDVTK